MLVKNTEFQSSESMPIQVDDFDPTILNDVHVLHAENVTPCVDTERAFRNALGSFGTGVALITANTERGPIGMTVNSFASVSLNPALVLWSIAKKSGRYEAFRNASHYAIHVLAKNQYELATLFAKNADVFEDSDWDMNLGKAPLAKRALARFECENEVVHDGGDHSILIGKVMRFSQRAGQPLIFNGGKFGTFSEDVMV